LSATGKQGKTYGQDKIYAFCFVVSKLIIIFAPAICSEALMHAEAFGAAGVEHYTRIVPLHFDCENSEVLRLTLCEKIKNNLLQRRLQI
jgi:hypothetical protein